MMKIVPVTNRKESSSLQLIITFIILGISIILFMSNRVRADLVAVLALLAFVLTGILDATEALVGFSNSVVIMIAGLFIVGAGLLRTGLAQMAGNVLLRSSGDSEKKLFILYLYSELPSPVKSFSFLIPPLVECFHYKRKFLLFIYNLNIFL